MNKNKKIGLLTTFSDFVNYPLLIAYLQQFGEVVYVSPREHRVDTNVIVMACELPTVPNEGITQVNEDQGLKAFIAGPMSNFYSETNFFLIGAACLHYAKQREFTVVNEQVDAHIDDHYVHYRKIGQYDEVKKQYTHFKVKSNHTQIITGIDKYQQLAWYTLRKNRAKAPNMSQACEGFWVKDEFKNNIFGTLSLPHYCSHAHNSHNQNLLENYRGDWSNFYMHELLKT